MSKKMYASFTMTPKAKRDWVAALRSGKYEQGKDSLLSDNGYCCLGVLCKLQGIDDAHLEFGDFPFSVGLFEDIGRDWCVPYKGSLYNLASLNDGVDGNAPLTFKQIANIIERSVRTH